MTSGKKAKQQRQRGDGRTTGKNTPLLAATDRQSINDWWRLTLALALLMAVGLIAYADIFEGPFLYDDLGNIQDNPFIRLNQVTSAKLKAILKSPSPRPLANLTFAINYFVHQYDVFGYHLVNVSVHIINAFLVFLIARLTLGLCGFQKTWLALPAALLWLVNPVHSQSVAYIVQRMNSLAALFYLLSMLSYIQGRLTMRWKGTSRLKPFVWFIACVLAGISGLLSKEIAATLPVAIFLYEWYFFRQLDKQWLRKQAPWVIFIFLLLFVLTLIYLKGHPLSQLANKYANKDFTLAQRLLTQPGVVLYYLSLLIFPFPDRLRVLYQIAPATGLILPVSTLTALIALAGLIAAAFLLGRRHRLASFAITWFLTTLAIESSIIPLAMVFEHRTYLPSVFVFIALTWLLFEKMTARKALALTFLVVILCVIGTRQRNTVWTDAVVFWSDAAAKTPQDPAIRNSLGLAYRERGDRETAILTFKTVLQQDETHAEAYSNIGMTLIELNRPAEAFPYLEKAIALNAELDKAYYNLGLALKQTGQMEKAESNYAKALAINPSYREAHINLGILKMERGQNDEARRHFQQALALDPDFEKAHISLGIVCFRKGQSDEALDHFRKALSINPDSAEAAGNLRAAAQVLARFGPTIQRLKQSLRGDPAVALQLAQAYHQAGMTDGAVEFYKQALSHDPGCKPCLGNLAGIYLTTRRYGAAAEMLEKLSFISPDQPEIYYGLAQAYAQDGRPEKALTNLKKAVSGGFDDIGHIRDDAALMNIRQTEYFRELTAGGGPLSY